MACAGSVGPGGHPWRQLGVTGYPSQEGTIEWACPHLVTEAPGVDEKVPGEHAEDREEACLPRMPQP